MAYIYKIEHNSTGKTYVGLTRQPIERRWLQHKNKALTLSGRPTPLHSAMYKEGVENFTFSILEECSDNILEQRESYWINELNSYHNGYNQVIPNSKRRGNNLMRKYYWKYTLPCYRVDINQAP